MIAARIAVALCLVLGAAARAQSPAQSASVSETRLAEHFSSPALGRDLSYALYLPPGYGEGAQRFPVIYLLHGVDGNDLEWLHTGYLRETLDALIAAGKVAPMIAVMPDGDNSWYVDSQAIGGPGDYARAIGDELPAHVDATLRTKAAPRYRAIGGLSMGGFGALRLAFQQPFRFAAAASFSGAFWARLTPESTLGERSDRIFKGSFGRPFDARRFLAQSPLTMVDGLAKSAHPPAVFLTVGDRDRYKLYADTFRLFQQMRDAGLPVDMRMTGGDHDWETWAEELPEVLLFFDRQFEAAAQQGD